MTARPAPSADDAGPVSDRGGLHGSLGDVSLVEVLQLLNFGRRSGTIVVEPQSPQGMPLPRGTLVVDSGQVRACKAGNLIGEDALFALLGCERGRFSVRFERVAVDVVNVTAETQFLLLEYLRRADEAAAEAPPATPGTGSFSSSTASWLIASPLPAAAPVAAAPPPPPPKRKRKETPPRPEASSEGAPPPSTSGRFARFFDEHTRSQLTPPPTKAVTTASSKPSTSKPSSSSTPPAKASPPPLPAALPKPGPKAPPPPPVDDDELAPAATERFASLAITINSNLNQTLSNTNGFERDTDIVDRALISA